MIPARIGSKGIPEKAIRPFDGEPLIFKVINTASCLENTIVYINTDSTKISNIVTKKYGDKVKIYHRPEQLGNDDVTLDELAFDFVKNRLFSGENLITIQPTSPLLRIETLTHLKAKFLRSNCDTIITVTEKRKLEWIKLNDGTFSKRYKLRVNRQQLDPIFEETGAVVMCRSVALAKSGSRFGDIVECISVDNAESIDIDNYYDWLLAESMAKGRKMVFLTFANRIIGSGHLQRTLSIAHYFPDFLIEIVLYETDEEWLELIKACNYTFHVFNSKSEAIVCVGKLKPTIVILDILSTELRDINDIRSFNNAKMVSFEDLGRGVNVTDLTINDLYPSVCNKTHVYNGPDYCFFREEFLNLPTVSNEDRQFDIIISFGGTDPNNLTLRILKILERCSSMFKIRVVLGLGAKRLKEEVHQHCLKSKHQINDSELQCGVSREWMNSKIGICGGGRTVYEFAACEVKTFVLCQNSRELTHMYSSEVNGIINMGVHSEVSDDQIFDSFSLIDENFEALFSDYEVRINPDENNKCVVDLIRNLV
jgi:CMP-N-acetylneuraminic acid synthetase/spore coat polysaccharide biosynthesis predicted glycosyltransferase SpsG